VLTLGIRVFDLILSVGCGKEESYSKFLCDLLGASVSVLNSSLKTETQKEKEAKEDLRIVKNFTIAKYC